MNLKNLLPQLLTVLVLIAAVNVGTVGLSAASAESTASPKESPDVAMEVVESETGIYYTVKPGDTLWGLSRKFSDSPYLWPDLWSGNPQIRNPHRIYPGERIRLYRREDVSVITSPVAEPPAAAAVEPVVPFEPQAPPAPEPSPEPLQEMPRSGLGTFTYSGIEQVGFIRLTPVAPYGKIVSVKGTKDMISTNDIVYIDKEGDHLLPPGRRYSVFRYVSKVYDTHTGEFYGTQHFILGVVEIIRSEEDFAVGEVIKSYLNIRKGDLLMPFERRTAIIEKQMPPPGIAGEVIMAEYQNAIIGDRETVFINRGAADGIRPGHIFDIFYQESGKIASNREDQTTLFGPEYYGKFLVLRTEENTSTVFILEAKDKVTAGSTFMSPIRLYTNVER